MTRASGEHAYGRYTIRTLAAADKVRARAFLGAKAVADTDAEALTLDDVLRIVRVRLDTRDGRQRDARQGGVPTAEEYVDAFARLDRRVGKHHRQMLQALFDAPEQTLTSTEIAAAAGYASYEGANAHLGKLARLVAEDLGYHPPTRADGKPIWTMSLATGANVIVGEDDGHWRWTLRPQVAEMMSRLNIGATAA